MNSSACDGTRSIWQSEDACRLFESYHPLWKYPVGTRGNGTVWLLDPDVERSDLDSCGVDHEDWMLPYLELPSGAIALDLASFIGTNAVWWAKRGVNVIAVEPIPQNRDLLYRNLILNGVTSKVTVIPKAFGDKRSVARMSIHSAYSHFAVDGDCLVDVVTVDDELLPFVTALDIIKLDVEGAECEVLHGARETISKFRPRIVVEVHSHMRGRESNGNILVEFFRQMNYAHQRIWQNSDAYYYVLATPRG